MSRALRNIGWVAVSGLLLIGHAAAQTFPADDAWVPLRCGDRPAWDPVADEAGAQGSRDIVGDDAFPAGFIAADEEFVFFRMRLDAEAAPRGEFASFGWAVEMDVDRIISTYELLLMVDGIANPDEVTFSQNTIQGTMDSPADRAEVLLSSNPASTHARAVPADSTFSGDVDGFVDFAVSIADLAVAGVEPTTPLVLFLGTSSSAHAITSDLMCNNGETDPFTLTDTGTDTTTWTGTDPAGDSDGDMILDAIDNCPDVPNPLQEDSDGDGAGDACDEDSDNDGIPDDLEIPIGTDPLDPDSDDDGVPDGLEVDLGTDPQDPDTDGDGIPDGTEIGRTTPGVGTNPDAGQFVPDADPTTTTDPTNPDTDGDGVPDGEEDCDRDGAVDAGERDPNDPTDAAEPACGPDRRTLEIAGGGGCSVAGRGSPPPLLFAVMLAIPRLLRRKAGSR